MGCAERWASVFPYLRRIAVIYLADWIKTVKFAALKHPENDKARDDTSIIWRLRNDAGHDYDDGHVQSVEPGVVFLRRHICKTSYNRFLTQEPVFTLYAGPLRRIMNNKTLYDYGF